MCSYLDTVNSQQILQIKHRLCEVPFGENLTSLQRNQRSRLGVKSGYKTEKQSASARLHKGRVGVQDNEISLLWEMSFCVCKHLLFIVVWELI